MCSLHKKKMNRQKLIYNVADYASSYLRDNLSEKLLFHNTQHTYEVVEAVKEIGKYSHLSETQFATVTVAAWFHDCGYAITYKGHEDESKKIAADFLRKQSYPEGFINSVLACIEATRYPQHPQSPEAKVICDADLYHFTRPDYHKYEEALRLEFNTFLSKKYGKEEWRNNNCEILRDRKSVV